MPAPSRRVCPRDLAPAELARRCHAETQGSTSRLTVITSDGRVLCDSVADAATMVNHLTRPEVAAALSTGTGVARRESMTEHAPRIYAAVRSGEGREARIVRVAIPAAIVAGPDRRLVTMLLLTVLTTVAIALLPALVVANRIGRRLERMVGFSRAVAGGELSARLPVARADEIGALEGNLNDMGQRLQESFRGLREESEKLRGVLGAMVEGVVVVGRDGGVVLMNERAQSIFGLPCGTDYRGRHLLEMCRDPELHEVLRALTARDAVRPALREITLADAERRVLAVSVSPLAGTGTASAGFVLVLPRRQRPEAARDHAARLRRQRQPRAAHAADGDPRLCGDVARGRARRHHPGTPVPRRHRTPFRAPRPPDRRSAHALRPRARQDAVQARSRAARTPGRRAGGGARGEGRARQGDPGSRASNQSPGALRRPRSSAASADQPGRQRRSSTRRPGET